MLPHLPEGSVVTVGSFDGLHAGHMAILAEVGRRAQDARRKAVLVTFEPHPAEVLRPDRAPARLTLPVERAEILAQAALDYLLVLHFDPALASRTAEAFVREVVVGRCQCRDLVVGEDHGFGRDREGGVDLLQRLGGELGFSVDVVPPVDVDGQRVSSTRVRALVAEGCLAEAAQCLGRPYTVSAVVERGAGRGRDLGFPTANLAVTPRKQLPPDGVYAVRVEWAGGVADGMLNQGHRPTFDDGRRLLEAHLFGFDGNLYGRTVRVTWGARLREVRRFDSVEALQAQLERDRAAAVAALAQAPGGQDHNRV
ncbi:MAG: bifunctional riboflavin kinase/FAD synthetase [Gemmatimonadales bacterium]